MRKKSAVKIVDKAKPTWYQRKSKDSEWMKKRSEASLASYHRNKKLRGRGKQMKLADAVVCLDCETVYEIKKGQCPQCCSKQYLTLAKYL